MRFDLKFLDLKANVLHSYRPCPIKSDSAAVRSNQSCIETMSVLPVKQTDDSVSVSLHKLRVLTEVPNTDQ